MKKIWFILALAFTASCEPTSNVDLPRYSDFPELPITQASSYIGYTEKSHRYQLKEFLGVDPKHTEWCAAFVNAVLNKSGIPGSETVSDYPLTARSFVDYGLPVSKEDVSVGDIVVFPRGSQGWQGHVGFYATSILHDGEKHYVILGGNQDDAVNYRLYPESKVIAIRRIQNQYTKPLAIEDL